MSLYEELQEKGTVIILRSRAERAYPCAYMDANEICDKNEKWALCKGIHDQMAIDIDNAELRAAADKIKREEEKKNPRPCLYYEDSPEV